MGHRVFYFHKKHSGQKANAGEELAKEVAELFRETAEERLASKNDLKNTEAMLQNDLEKFRSELQVDLKNTETRLQNDLEKFRSELKADIDIKIQSSKVELIKWIVGLLIAQTGIIVTATGVMMSVMK